MPPRLHGNRKRTHTRTRRQSLTLARTRLAQPLAVVHRRSSHQSRPPSCSGEILITNIWNVLQTVCSGGCRPSAAPKVGGILLIVKFKWITGNITLPRLARTGPPGASLPRCNSVTGKLKAFQINQSIQYATHLVWVTNPPRAADDKISYRAGFRGKSTPLTACCGEVANLVYSLIQQQKIFRTMKWIVCACACRCCVFRCVWAPVRRLLLLCLRVGLCSSHWGEEPILNLTAFLCHIEYSWLNKQQSQI